MKNEKVKTVFKEMLKFAEKGENKQYCKDPVEYTFLSVSNSIIINRILDEGNHDYLALSVIGYGQTRLLSCCQTIMMMKRNLIQMLKER